MMPARLLTASVPTEFYTFDLEATYLDERADETPAHTF